MDLFDKCSSAGGYFGKYRLAQDKYFSQPILEPHPGRIMKFKGSNQIMWSINNYLGLAENKEIQTTALAAVSEFSTVLLDPPWPEIIRLAGRLIGRPRGLSVHCGGVVLTPGQIWQRAPIHGNLEFPAKRNCAARV